MRQLFFASVLMLSFVLNANATDPITHTEKKTIKTEESSVAWTGKKVTGQHNGTINIKSGNLEFDHGKFIGGSVTIDMTSITCSDFGEKGARKIGRTFKI